MFLLHDPPADCGGIFAGRRGPVQFGDVLDGTQAGGGVSVALEAEIHIQRLYLPDLDHLVDAAVAANATDSRVDMRAVIEIHIVGKFVDVNPGNGLPRRVALAHLLKQRALRLHTRVTVHANFRRRYRCIRCLIYGVMTVVAVHAHISGVQLMTIRNGLDGLISGFHVGRSCEVREGCDTHYREQSRCDAANLDVLINNFGEESRHYRTVTSGFLLLFLLHFDTKFYHSYIFSGMERNF